MSKVTSNVKMRKNISILLVCSLLFVFLSACTPNSSRNAVELKDVFEMIRLDAEVNKKIELSVSYEQLHYDLIKSRKHFNCSWTSSSFRVVISCDYDKAVNEDWYKQCVEKDVKSLNTALCNYYAKGISKADEVNTVYFSSGMQLIYCSWENFNDDYLAIKTLAQLDYVTKVGITYSFGLPVCYILE